MKRISRLSAIVATVSLIAVLILSGCSNSNEPAATQNDPSATGNASDGSNANANASGEAADGSNDANGQNGNQERNTEASVPTSFSQAPMLDGQDLPPVNERLPKVPKVVNEIPPENMKYEIGTYGGTLRTARDQAETDNTIFIATNEPLVNNPGLEGKETTPNVVESYELSDDKKVYTFRLREGMKWSDGVPVTTEDVRFAVEDVLLNDKLNPGGVPVYLRSGNNAHGTPLKLEVVDNYTFKISFDVEYGGFLFQLSTVGWHGYNDLIKPKHFLEKYHIKYTPLEQLEPEIKKAEFKQGEWWNLFNKKDIGNGEITFRDAIGFPVLTPYIQVTNTNSSIEFVRNPYYFKVDAAGNQLPYIDKLSSSLVKDTQAVLLKIMAGEIDTSYEFVTLPQVALLKENEEKGGFKVYLTKLHRTAGDIFINLTYDDPVWRQVVRDVRFRKALNLALDKQDIADTIYYGYAAPDPIEGTDRNMEEAAKLLDEMGMKKGPDGFRVGPDGKKFTIPIEEATWFDTMTGTIDLAAQYWRELGFNVTVKPVDLSLYLEHNTANEVQVSVLFTSGPAMWEWPDWGQGYIAPLWNSWMVSNGKEGEEPPAEFKQVYDDMNSVSQFGIEKAREQYDKVVKSMSENYWYLIPTKDITLPVAVNAKIGNYTENGYGIAQNFGAEAWYFKP